VGCDTPSSQAGGTSNHPAASSPAADSPAVAASFNPIYEFMT
jgi:hypothetical protein